MTTDVATQILVIFLSVALLAFLVCGIVVGILLIRVTKQIKNITNITEKTAMKVNDVVNETAQYVAPVAVAGAIKNAFKMFSKKKSKRKE